MSADPRRAPAGAPTTAISGAIELVGLVDLQGSQRRVVTSVLSLRRTLKRLRPTVVYAPARGPILVAVLATRGLRGRPV